MQVCGTFLALLAICGVLWVGVWPQRGLGADLRSSPILFTCVPLGSANQSENVRGTVIRVDTVIRPNEQSCLAERSLQQDTIITVKTSAGNRRLWLARDYQMRVTSKLSITEIVTGSRVLVISVPENEEADRALSIWILPPHVSDDAEPGVGFTISEPDDKRNCPAHYS